MKHCLRFAALVVAAALALFAMSENVNAQPTWEIGLKAGLGIAKLTGDTEGTETFDEVIEGGYRLEGTVSQSFDDTKLGFVGGAYGAVHINERFGVRLEALYAMKGGEGKNSGTINIFDPAGAPVGTATVSGDNTVTLDYFEVPLLAVVSFPVSPQATVDIFAGPALAFNINAEIESEFTLSAGGESETETEKIDIGDDVEGTDFGGVIGAGVNFELTNVVIFGEARWTYGFKDVDKYEASEIKNSAFGFMVGIGIPLAQGK